MEDRRGPNGGSARQAGGIDGGAVAQGVDAGDGEREIAALPAEEAGQGAAHVAVSDEGEFQSPIVA